VADDTTTADRRTNPGGSRRSVSRVRRRSSVPVTMNAAIAAGGALGALARVELDRLFPPSPGGWPWITFLINVAGSALLGYLATRLVERLPPSTYRRPFVGTGFCGALTTFSTFQVELVRLVRTDHVPLAAGYATASILSGLLAVLVTTHLARRARWSFA
jgi:fluoride exporter